MFFVSCLLRNVLSQLIPFKDHFDNFFTVDEKKTHIIIIISALVFLPKGIGDFIASFSCSANIKYRCNAFSSVDVKRDG